jgi:hypothetical protein
MPLDAAGLHASLIPNAGQTDRTMLDGTQYYGSGILDARINSRHVGGRQVTVRQHLAARPANRQFQYDAALWYGAIAYPAVPWHSAFLLRALGVLFYGDLLVSNGAGGWTHWADVDIPIVSALSHTARVTIQLGTAGSESDGFWAWLWGGQATLTRAAATHGIENLAVAETLVVNGRTYHKYLREVSSNRGGVSHFGVNIALGGDGYLNPVSGKVIRGNGKHGHFYMAYLAPTPTRHGVVLLATEQSCPLDVYNPHDAGTVKTFAKRAGMFFKAVATLGVPDQYGGYHGFGGHSRFSATGGDDWTRDQLANVGPRRYYDGMFVDLSGGFNRVRGLADNFAVGQIGHQGLVSPLPVVLPPVPVVLPPAPIGLPHAPLAPVGRRRARTI